MRVVVLLSEADPSAWDRATDAEREAVFAAHAAFDAAVRGRGALVLGEALAGAEEARGLVGGAPVDGPFAEAAEHLTGFYVLDVEGLDEAEDLCALLPAGYTVELRPTVVIEGYDG